MSQDFMDPEIFADFIIEAKEHLETIEPNLLELEKEPGNISLLNEIFRPMHSLKGASGFLGLNKINVLAHKAENIMDELRKGDMSVTAEIMDVILSATDALRQMIDNLETQGGEGEVATEAIIHTLDALLAGESTAAPAAVEASAEEVAAPAAEAVVTQADGVLVDDAASLEMEEGKPYALTAFGEGHLRDFIEEAREMTESLSSGLLELEKNPLEPGELVNDIFRYFHNLKGNSGIIGFNELNSITHEAETLLNRARKGELAVTQGLIDLLLFVVDIIESLVAKVDPASGTVVPLIITDAVTVLQKAVNEGVIEAPVRGRQEAAAPAPETAAAEDAVEGESGLDAEDVDLFLTTTSQQNGAIKLAMGELEKDGSQRDYIDVLFRSLTTVQNSCGYMGFESVKVHAGRTAGLVDNARNSDLDFSLMLPILSQEIEIMFDMLGEELDKLGIDKGRLTGAPVAVGAEAPKPAEAAPAPKPAPQPEKKPEPKPAPKAEPKPQPKPAAPKPAALAPKPAAAQPKPAAPAPKPGPTGPTGPAKPAAPAAPPPNQAAQAADQSKGKSSSTIRVDHEKLDHLMNLIGELIINRNRYTMLARHLESGQDVDVADVAQNLTETTYAMARISDDLQDTIMKVRMVPVSSVFSRFPRLVRDLSRKSGKEVDLIMEGEETELDKSVVEVIGDPLVHLIRNAMDHGVEAEDVRVAAGKPAKGKVWLRAYHRGNSVAIEIEDDGKGIDPEKMREVAIRKGVITPEEAKNLDDREAMELIFAPGFSSAETITDISGRGVGMDVVRTNIKNLKGSVTITSEVGKGTRFTLSLPLTLAIIDALMVNVAGENYAIPLDAVSETTKIEARRLTDVKGRKAVTLRGEVLGIVSMAELLELPEPEEQPEVLSVVVIHDNQRRLGIVVDKLHERQEIVIKPLGEYLGDVKGISGATIMGDGSVILILDPHEIYLLATSKAM
ncbi:MAG: Hpt domain-containing protein [Halodesulfovibrio sp.]